MNKVKQQPSTASQKYFPNRFFKISSVVAVVLLISCSAPMDARKDASFQSYANVNGRPTVRPV
jgi:hypothetical protein